MRVALLSAGPSLVRTFDESERFDLRIGVNSAVGFFRCDWWSCGDGQTFERVYQHRGVIGLPVLFCMSPDCSRFRATSRLVKRYKAHRVVGWHEVRKRVHPPANWDSFSVVASVPLAVDLGATRIDVYGHDCMGTVDVSGHDMAKRAYHFERTDGGSVQDRWAMITEWAADKGTEIVEHQPEYAA